MDSPKAVFPKSLRRFSSRDLEELRSMPKWTAADWSKVSGHDSFKALGFTDYAIGTRGSRDWTAQGAITIPGSSVIQIFNPQGSMYVGYQGWPLPVDPTGRFTDGSVQHADTSDFVVQGLNKFCLLAKTPSLIFTNPKIPNWGASISSLDAQPGTNYWIVGANEGGRLFVAFNDNYDPDNHGYLTAIVRLSQAVPFADINATYIDSTTDEKMQ